MHLTTGMQSIAYSCTASFWACSSTSCSLCFVCRVEIQPRGSSESNKSTGGSMSSSKVIIGIWSKSPTVLVVLIASHQRGCCTVKQPVIGWTACEQNSELFLAWMEQLLPPMQRHKQLRGDSGKRLLFRNYQTFHFCFENFVLCCFTCVLGFQRQGYGQNGFYRAARHRTIENPFEMLQWHLILLGIHKCVR